MRTRQEMTALLVVDPEKARRAIRAAMVRAKASRAAAAELLGCGRTTFWRWVEKLGMTAELEGLEATAKAEGRHHGRVGGWPKGRARKQAL